MHKDDENDSNTIEKGEKLDEQDETTVRRRKKVILTGVFIENDADIALDKLSSMKTGRF